MRQTLETRQISLIDNIVTRSMGEKGFTNFFELMRYEWEDFETKYGSENNVEPPPRGSQFGKTTT